MNIDKRLISSAMLTAMCANEDIDNLKLLEPFVLMCINECAELGKEIPKERVLKMLDTQYAFQEMPEVILEKVLRRIARNRKDKIVSGTSGGRFVFLKRPQNQVDQFKSQEDRARRNSSDVISKLQDWFRENRPKYAKAEDVTREYLAKFFEENGLDVLFDTGRLREATVSNSDIVNYEVGRFIINARDSDAELFEKIISIAQGVMLASTIYVDTTPTRIFKSQHRLKDVKVYLDTTLILQALDFKEPEQKQSVDALLMLLKSSNAQIYVFYQHFVEIIDILTAFKNHDALSSKSAPPLVGLQKKELTSIEIDVVIRDLEKTLSEIGISVDRDGKYVDEKGELHEEKGGYINYNKLKERLTDEMPGYGTRESRIDNDVNAICGINIMRAGIPYSEIESCVAIFVTTNYDLIRICNNFLGYKPYTQYITPTMSATDLTTILWIKYGMKVRKDVPQLKLVENALAALSPSAYLMETFERVAKRMVDQGSISEEMAAFIRHDAYSRAELCALCGGDASQLEDTTILTVLKKAKEKLVGEGKAEIKRAETEAAKARQAADAAQQEIETIRNEMEKAQAERRESAERAIETLTRKADMDAKRMAQGISLFCCGILCLVVFAVAGVAIYALICSSIQAEIGTFNLIVLAITIASTIALFIPAFKIIRGKIKKWIFSRVRDIFYDHKVNKLKPEIDRIRELANMR